MWSAALLEADLHNPESANAIADEIDGYLRALAFGERRARDDSLISDLVEAEEQGLLSATEVSAMAFLLLTAGYETSVNLIGNGVFSLLRTPEAWQRLCADPSLAGAAVEEVLRFESPLEFATPRHVAADLMVAGKTLRRGDLVLVGLGAANRDPRAFAAANAFDMGRRGSARHLAFGQGVHACPGAPLARLEGEAALTALARRLPSLTLARPPEALQWVPGLVMRGLAALPVVAASSFATDRGRAVD